MDIEQLEAILAAYSSLLVIIQSTGLFAFFATLPGPEAGKASLWGRALLFIDARSFGIYLIHMVWIRLVLRYWALDPYVHGPWLFPLLIVANLIVSTLVVWILEKIPGLSKIL